jgi:hypothetical protein
VALGTALVVGLAGVVTTSSVSADATAHGDKTALAARDPANTAKRVELFIEEILQELFVHA